MKRVLLVAAVFATTASLSAPALAAIGEPAADASGSVFREDEWVAGEPRYNYVASDAYAGAQVHTPRQVPSAGDTFYVHTQVAFIPTGVFNDTIGVTMGLPQGVSVAVSASTPIRCFVSSTRGTAGVPSRDTSDCLANPSPASGSQIPLGAITLFTGGVQVGGEIAHVFVPVVSNRAVNGENVSVTATVVNPNASPRDIPATAPLTVGPGSGPQPATLTKPTGKVFKWRKKGRVLVAWQPVPGATGYKARLKVGKKWTKWAELADRGLKLTKLKKGKKYVLQVRAVGPGGDGPAVKWRFKGK